MKLPTFEFVYARIKRHLAARGLFGLALLGSACAHPVNAEKVDPGVSPTVCVVDDADNATPAVPSEPAWAVCGG